MGDIITTFSKIGALYMDDEKRVKNKAYEYDILRVYLYDIETKSIEVDLNIPKEEMIITRFGVGANSGNLFPNMPFEPKQVQSDFSKFVRGIIKANKNLLSYFSKEEIEQEALLQQIASMDESFFIDKEEQIQALPKQKKEKGKVATYFALSFENRPLSAHFKALYEEHLSKTTQATVRGCDIIDNGEGIGGDANLAFCSVNDLPKNLQSIKARLLPLSHENAKRVKIGFDVMDKMLSHNFYGLKMAIMPTLLSQDETLYKEVIEILEESAKGDIKEIEDSEAYISGKLENIAKKEQHLPIVNTILFYNKNNAAIEMLLQIDDILPSYISFVSDALGAEGIKAFKIKDSSDAEGTLYMQNLFEDRLEIMNILLSTKKINKAILIEKFAQLIYWGNINKKYAYRIDWSIYFNNLGLARSIEAINRYIAFFNSAKKLKKSFKLQKECIVETISDKHEKITTLIHQSEFLENDVLKTAYLLGMLSGATMNWQYGVSGNDSYNKWLNNLGTIDKHALKRIWHKLEETIRKLHAQATKGNRTVETIKDLVVLYAASAFTDKTITQSAYVSLAFAMGGSDFTKHIKDKKKKEEK